MHYFIPSKELITLQDQLKQAAGIKFSFKDDFISDLTLLRQILQMTGAGKHFICSAEKNSYAFRKTGIKNRQLV